MEDAMQQCLDYLNRFITHPNSGVKWKQRASFGVEYDAMDEEKRVKFVKEMKENMEARCGSTFPPEFHEAHKLLKTTMWKHEEFFVRDNSTSQFPAYKALNVFNENVNCLVNTAMIRVQLEYAMFDVDAIPTEWQSLKTIMSRWPKHKFPPESWKYIGEETDACVNLFGLIDYFLCLTVTSADAERGFSVMKELKTNKRAVLKNTHLQNQMRVKLDGPSISDFDYDLAIDNWYFSPTSQSKSGVARKKRPAHGDKFHNKPGPKPKQFIPDPDI